MDIKFKSTDNKVNVSLMGELDTPATVEIQPEIDKIVQMASKEIVIDCSKLSYIASSGLRQLITIHKKCKSEGGEMKLINVNADVMEIFSVTRFDKVFDISEG